MIPANQLRSDRLKGIGNKFADALCHAPRFPRTGLAPAFNPPDPNPFTELNALSAAKRDVTAGTLSC